MNINLLRCSRTITEPIARRNATLLVILLLLRTLALIVIIVYLNYISTDGFSIYGLFPLSANVIGFFIARSRYYQIAAWLVIAEGLVGLPLIVSLNPSLLGVVTAPLGVSFIVVLSSLVLPFRQTLITLFLSILSIAVIWLTTPMELHQPLGALVAVSGFSTILVIIGTYLRERADHLLEEERAKVIQLSKLSALGEMAGGIAHEINTPLTVITLNAQLIEKNLIDGNENRDDMLRRAQSIVRVVGRIAKIISGLKGFSRDAAGDPWTKFTLRELIDLTLDLCQEKFKNNGVKLIFSDTESTHLVHGQSVHLSQALLNLLNNSFDAIQNHSQKWIRIDIEQTTEWLRLKVSDCGEGLSTDIAKKLFQPFFTTKDVGHGTGLGLSISRNILKTHGGDLFYDESAKNTCFVIQLPRLD
ncbi:MAG: ATP-binding protein [Proteobacteria bacterium]|nr:ATP-binding protein [Pseudomonadota bacterium]